MKLQKLLKWFICITIVLSLFANIFTSLSDGNLTGIFSLRNLFLLLFLSCFILYSKWSLLLIILINIFFWYLYFTTNANIAYYDNPVTHYTMNIQNLFYSSNNINVLGKIIIFLPLLINILISFIDIPLRVYKLKRTSS